MKLVSFLTVFLINFMVFMQRESEASQGSTCGEVIPLSCCSDVDQCHVQSSEGQLESLGNGLKNTLLKLPKFDFLTENGMFLTGAIAVFGTISDSISSQKTAFKACLASSGLSLMTSAKLYSHANRCEEAIDLWLKYDCSEEEDSKNTMRHCCDEKGSEEKEKLSMKQLENLKRQNVQSFQNLGSALLCAYAFSQKVKNSEKTKPDPNLEPNLISVSQPKINSVKSSTSSDDESFSNILSPLSSIASSDYELRKSSKKPLSNFRGGSDSGEGLGSSFSGGSDLKGSQSGSGGQETYNDGESPHSRFKSAGFMSGVRKRGSHPYLKRKFNQKVKKVNRKIRGPMKLDPSLRKPSSLPFLDDLLPSEEDLIITNTRILQTLCKKKELLDCNSRK